MTAAPDGQRKSGHGRVVPLAPELAEALAKLRLRGYSEGQDDLIFVAQHGSHMDPPRFRERFYAAQDRANIRPRRLIHQLRHSFAVAMARHGAALGAIQRWLGHSSSQTTEIYAAFTPGDVEAALVTEAFAQ